MLHRIDNVLMQRATCASCMAFQLVWMWIAPAIQNAAGNYDEAAWLPLFLLPTLFLGGAIGVGNLIVPHKWAARLFFVIFIAHIVIGLGLHGR